MLVLLSSAYVCDYYRASDFAMEELNEAVNDGTNHPGVDVIMDSKRIVFEPENATEAIVFYPGGKVEAEAYVPLLLELADKGVMTVFYKMPAKLAFLDINAADGIQEEYPYINDWYMMGHSLGGVAAASYIEEYAEEYEGIIFLASYPSADLSKTDLRMLSIRGSEDKVLNFANYQENMTENSTADMKEVIIDGGCHAYFGSYGHQKGDGEPTITEEEQRYYTVEEIYSFINE